MVNQQSDNNNTGTAMITIGEDGWVSAQEAHPEMYKVVEVYYKGYWPFVTNSEYHYTYTHRDGTWSGFDSNIHDVEVIAWRYEVTED